MKKKGLIGKMDDVSVGDLIKLIKKEKETEFWGNGEAVGYVCRISIKKIVLSLNNPFKEDISAHYFGGKKTYFLRDMTDYEIIEPAKKQ